MPVKKHWSSLKRAFRSTFFSTVIWIGVGVVLGATLFFGFILLFSFLLQPRETAPTLSQAQPISSAATSTVAIANNLGAITGITTTPIIATSTIVLPPKDTFAPNGSFTEVFSGTGWINASETSAYLDPTAIAISLMPEFTVASTTGAEMGEAIPPLPANVTGTVAEVGDEYQISALGHTVTSSYPGILRFGYDPKTGNALVVYAAYRSRVFQVDAHGAVIDYSDRFGPRAFGGPNNGDLAVHPAIFSENGAWWIASDAGSSKPFLEEISGSSIIDYASLAFPNVSTLRALPGLTPHSVFVTGDAENYLLNAEGFSGKNVQCISLRLNSGDGNIKEAVISNVDDSDTYKTAGTSEGAIRYFLSNDGGASWVPATVGTPVKFSSTGGDFRFKVELAPAEGDSFVSPWASVLALEYQIEGK